MAAALHPTVVAALCARVGAALRLTDADLVTCDVARLTAPDAGDVDALARLQLTARRLGSSIRLRYPSDYLCELLDLVGLRGAVPCVS